MIDKSKAAPGFHVSTGLAVPAGCVTLSEDRSFARTAGPRRCFANGDMQFGSVEAAIEQSHQTYDARCRPKLEDFAERFAAWWGSARCLAEHDRWMSERDPSTDRSLGTFLRDAIVQMASGERELPEAL